MSSNFWDDDAKPVTKTAAPTAKADGFWEDDAPAKDDFWEDDQPQQMTMARGTERRQIDANPQAMHEAEAEGFNTPEAQANLGRYKPRTPYSPVVAGARAVTSSALMGFDDEATGLVGGALGGVQGKGFVSSYKNSRDRTRAENEAAIKDQPVASIAGSLIGGAAVPGFAALKAGRIGGAIANGAITGGVMGGVQGLGDSKDITDLPDVAKEVGMGAGKGALTGGIVGAGAHAATHMGDVKELPGYAKAMFKGATKGAAATWPIPKLQALGIPLGAMHGAMKHYKANGIKMAEEAVEKSARHPSIKIGNPPGMRDLSSDEVGKINGGAMDNAASSRKVQINPPRGKLVTARTVAHNGKNLRHEIYKNNGEIIHSLVDENGNRMAEISGVMKRYQGKDGFAVSKSASSPDSDGHGKKLYDMALDTHGKVFSDKSLSPKGARPVYEEHFPNQPGVEVTPDTRGTKDRFQVDLKDQAGFREKGGIAPFDDAAGKDLKKLNKVGIMSRLGFHGSPDDAAFYDRGDTGSKLAEKAGSVLDKGIEAGKKYAINRAVRTGTDAAYNAATGTEEGLPDPLRDQATEYLKEKFNLTDSQAQAMKKAMPSVYDLAARGGKSVLKAHDNLVGKRENYKAQEPTGKLVMDREINHNGQKLRHEIFKDGTEIQHYLVDETGQRIADIKGKMHEYKGDTGLAIHWSGSSTKGQGHGKKLYDLVLDTHNKVFSDDSLSPDGSRKVYEDHYAYSPGVRVDFDTRHTPDRFKVNLKNPERFRTAKGIDPWSMEHENNLKDVNAMPDGYRPRTHDDGRYDPSSDSSLARANERAVADFLARVRRGEDPSAARMAVADAHPGASPYSVGLAARQYRERMDNKPQTIESETENRARSQDIQRLMREGRTFSQAVDFLDKKPVVKDTDIPFKNLEVQKTQQFDALNSRGDDSDWRYRNQPTERSPTSSQAMREAAESYLSLTDNGASHEQAMGLIVRNHGVKEDSLNSFLEGWQDAPSPTELRNRINPPDQMRDEKGNNNRLALEIGDNVFGSPEMQQRVRAEERAALPKPERPMTNVTPRPSVLSPQARAMNHERLDHGTGITIRDAVRESIENGGSVDDAVKVLHEKYGVKNPQTRAYIEQFHAQLNRPDQRRTDEALRRMKSDSLDGPDSRGNMQLKDDFRQEESDGGYRLDWDQIDGKANRQQSERDAIEAIHERSYRAARDGNTQEYKDFLFNDQLRRDQEWARRDLERRQEKEANFTRKLKGKLTEDMSEEEMRKIADRVSGRGEIDQRRVDHFRAERLRSKMHSVGSEPPRPITLQDQVRRAEAERAEAARKQKEEQWNSLMSQVERAQNKTPARPPRRLRVVPNETEMKAMLKKKKKDKK